jgi:hypothetical protein
VTVAGSSKRVCFFFSSFFKRHKDTLVLIGFSFTLSALIVAISIGIASIVTPILTPMILQLVNASDVAATTAIVPMYAAVDSLQS